MADARARLTKCFSSVFPKLSESEIPAAGLKTMEGWDSVATITLLTVIEEEFGAQFEPEEMEHLDSFQAILDCLSGKKGLA